MTMSTHIRTAGRVTEVTSSDSVSANLRPRIAALDAINDVVREKRLRKVLMMIESQPSRSVSELANEVQLSPAHLQRLFKQETGVHVRDVIVERRLQDAARLLSTSDMTIKEIAHAVGYEHPSSFVRAFHRRFAQAPRHYRQQDTRTRRDVFEICQKAAAD